MNMELVTMSFEEYLPIPQILKKGVCKIVKCDNFG